MYKTEAKKLISQARKTSGIPRWNSLILLWFHAPKNQFFMIFHKILWLFYAFGKFLRL